MITYAITTSIDSFICWPLADKETGKETGDPRGDPKQISLPAITAVS